MNPTGLLIERESTFVSSKAEKNVFVWEVQPSDLEGLFVERDNPITKADWITSKGYNVGERVVKYSEWCMRITKQKDNNGFDYMSLFLWLVRMDNGSVDEGSMEPKFVDVIYKFTLTEGQKMLIRKESSVRRFYDGGDEGSIWGWTYFLPISKLSKPIGSGGPIVIRVSLIILEKSFQPYACLQEPSICDNDVEVQLDPDSKNSFVENATTTKLNQGQIDKYKQMVADLWETKKGWDVEIKLGEHMFKAHASVLSARSPYFKREFLGLTVPSGQKKSFTMGETFSPVVVETLLEHCYKGEIPQGLSFDESVQLYKAAHQFEMRVLKDDAFRFLSTIQWGQINNFSIELGITLVKLAKECPPSKPELEVLANWFAENMGKLLQNEDFVEFRNKEVEDNGWVFFSYLMWEVGS